MLTANIRNLQMCKVLLNRPPVDPTKAKFGFFPFVSESQHPRHDWGGGGSEAPSRDGRPHLRGEEAPLGRGAGRCGERNQVGTGSNLVQEFRLCYLSGSMMGGGIPQRLWRLKGTHPSKWQLIKNVVLVLSSLWCPLALKGRDPIKGSKGQAPLREASG